MRARFPLILLVFSIALIALGLALTIPIASAEKVLAQSLNGSGDAPEIGYVRASTRFYSLVDARLFLLVLGAFGCTAVFGWKLLATAQSGGRAVVAGHDGPPPHET